MTRSKENATAIDERETGRQTRALEEWVAGGGERWCKFYGQRYGTPDSDGTLRRVRDEWLLPQLGQGKTVLEIGSGGGRWSRYFPGRVAAAILVDGTSASETAVRRLWNWDRFTFLVSPDGMLPSVADASMDYVFSYDTFVHFHRELFDQYIAEVGRVLKPGGVLHLHYAKMWRGQQDVNARCFQYRDPRDVISLLRSAGMEVTERFLPVRTGFGSLLIEAIRR